MTLNSTCSAEHQARVDALNDKKKFSLHYLNDGFVKVCDVDPKSFYCWDYVNINKEVMFSEHHGWIYMIVLNDEVVKIGETERRLGIPMSDGQPQKGTKCRLGRLRNGSDTDSHIRNMLAEDIRGGATVSIYARPCPTVYTKQIILGKEIAVPMMANKFYEKIYIEDYKRRLGYTPLLNRNSR